VLLYYFGSKEDLVVRALARLRERQRATFSGMREARYEQPSDACRAMWKQMSSPQSEPLFKFFFETYALALRNPRRFGDFLNSAVEDWLEFVAEPMIRKGHPKKEARAFATIVIAGFRGFMLDYCASHDRERIDRAVDLWLRSLDTIPLAPEVSHVG
jgi:AcrR family transcriptional regulator